jgi:hypothetical protein
VDTLLGRIAENLFDEPARMGSHNGELQVQLRCAESKMSSDRNLDDKELAERAKAYRSRAEKALKHLGITGEYYCDEQRERWLDELSKAYIDDAKGRRVPRLYEINRPGPKGPN